MTLYTILESLEAARAYADRTTGATIIQKGPSTFIVKGEGMPPGLTRTSDVECEANTDSVPYIGGGEAA